MLVAAATSQTTTPDEDQLALQVRTALGFRYIPRALGPEENPTCLTVWSVRELQDVYAHVGGTVTVRPVTRLFDGGTYDVIEVVLSAELDGIGTVAVVTEWNPADEAHGFALPVIQASTPKV